MQTICKYPLEITDEQAVRMPREAEVLTAQFQRGRLCLWAICFTGDRVELGWTDRLVKIIGTGNPIDPALDQCDQYAGTVQQDGGSLVWHVFVRAEGK